MPRNSGRVLKPIRKDAGPKHPEIGYTRGEFAQEKQKKLAAIWVEDKLSPHSGKSYNQMMLEAGYSEKNAMQNARRQLLKRGTQHEIAKITQNMKEALDDAGVTAAYLAEKVQALLDGRFPKDQNFRAINAGLEHALKIGVGGGYAPTEVKAIQLNITPQDMAKYAPLRDEYEEKLRQVELNEKPAEDV